jgi:hypothetical protein
MKKTGLSQISALKTYFFLFNFLGAFYQQAKSPFLYLHIISIFVIHNKPISGERKKLPLDRVIYKFCLLENCFWQKNAHNTV